jgi:hypothetical protein
MIFSALDGPKMGTVLKTMHAVYGLYRLAARRSEPKSVVAVAREIDFIAARAEKPSPNRPQLLICGVASRSKSRPPSKWQAVGSTIRRPEN